MWWRQQFIKSEPTRWHGDPHKYLLHLTGISGNYLKYSIFNMATTDAILDDLTSPFNQAERSGSFGREGIEGLMWYLPPVESLFVTLSIVLYPLLSTGSTQKDRKSSHTGPRSAVGNVFGNRCESDCRSRDREFDPGPVPYFRGDWSWNNFYGHSPPFRWIIQEGLFSVTSESMCTKYWLTACSSLPRKKCG